MDTKRVYVPYTIQPGDTLSGISLHFLGSGKLYAEIARINSMEMDSRVLLRAGTTIMIPVPLTPALMESAAIQEALSPTLRKDYPVNAEEARKVYTQVRDEITHTGDYDDRLEAHGKRAGIAVFAEALGILSHPQFLEEMDLIEHL